MEMLIKFTKKRLKDSFKLQKSSGKGNSFFIKRRRSKNKLDDIYNNAFNHKEAKGVLEFLFE